MNTLTRYFAIRDLPTRGDADDLTAPEMLVLYTLNAYSDAAGACHPSLELIAKRSRLHRATVHASIKRLEALGHLSIVSSRGRTSNHYRVTVVQNDRSTVALDDGCSSNRRPERHQPSSSTTRTVALDDPKRIKKKILKKRGPTAVHESELSAEERLVEECYRREFFARRRSTPNYQRAHVRAALRRMGTVAATVDVIERAYRNPWAFGNTITIQQIASDPDRVPSKPLNGVCRQPLPEGAADHWGEAAQ